MNAAALLGGKTRFITLEALAEAKQPMTAYQIAVNKGLDPAATYRCLTEFSEAGVAKSEMKERNQTYYKLSDDVGKAAAGYLESLKRKRTKPIDLEEWLSPEMQAERMTNIVRLDPIQLNIGKGKQSPQRKTVSQLLSDRIAGELGALIESSQIAFNELFERNGDVFTLRT